MKLYLVRHGEAVPDFENPKRPLSIVGEEEISFIAQQLKKRDVVVDDIWASTKLRAQQTASIIKETIGASAEVIVKDFLSPDHPIQQAKSEIDKQQNDLLIASHLPFLPRLVANLLGGDTIQFRTGTAACLEYVSNQWSYRWSMDPES